MNTACRLCVVSWLYIAVGAYGLIELIVGFFTPLSEPAIQLYIHKINVAGILVPLGIGLLKQISLCRKLAVIMSWLFLVFLMTVMFLLGLGEIANIGEVSWTLPTAPLSGDEIVRMIGGLVIGAPLFVWQLRVLMSTEVKELIGSTNAENSKQAKDK
jgi:hypothetical protein